MSLEDLAFKGPNPSYNRPNTPNSMLLSGRELATLCRPNKSCLFPFLAALTNAPRDPH